MYLYIHINIILYSSQIVMNITTFFCMVWGDWGATCWWVKCVWSWGKIVRVESSCMLINIHILVGYWLNIPIKSDYLHKMISTSCGSEITKTFIFAGQLSIFASDIMVFADDFHIFGAGHSFWLNPEFLMLQSRCLTLTSIFF